MIGFPISEKIGQSPSLIHWIAFELPSPPKPTGFRDTQALYKHELNVLTSSDREIRWINTENWNKNQLTRRGSVTEVLYNSRFAIVGCGRNGTPPSSEVSPETEVKQPEPDDPEVVQSVERMLSKDCTEAQAWAEKHQPTWAPGIKRIYEAGATKVVIYERDEEFIGRIPYAMIIDRGGAAVEPVQKALGELLAEQKIRDHGQTMTSRYSVLFLY